MTENVAGTEFALIIHTNDPAVRDGIEKIVPAEDFSASDNFVGGTEIAVFLKYGMNVIKTIFDFLKVNQKKISSAKVVVGKAEFRLEGYSAEDVHKILESPGFQKALKSTRSPAS